MIFHGRLDVKYQGQILDQGRRLSRSGFHLGCRTSPVNQRGQLICVTGHRNGGGRIVNCPEPAGKCRSACAEHSGQKLLPVVGLVV